jgi:hypothetical protein
MSFGINRILLICLVIGLLGCKEKRPDTVVPEITEPEFTTE